ncbi:hypothetical protein ACIHJG_09545 [Streptomyces sp. NPDC052415]|uniref:hypothetical protein n=1 Tax=Streptomyces sp. NPDC052415 TaxID=3365690 RepID=UPI0037D0C681
MVRGEHGQCDLAGMLRLAAEEPDHVGFLRAPYDGESGGRHLCKAVERSLIDAGSSHLPIVAFDACGVNGLARL